MDDSAQTMIPVKLDRVFDSCCDRACFCDIPVSIPVGELPAQVCSVKVRGVTISALSVSAEPVPFQHGFFTVSISLTFAVSLFSLDAAGACLQEYSGIAAAQKQYILFGSEVESTVFCAPLCSEQTVVSESVSFPAVHLSALPPTVLAARITRIGTQRTAVVDIGAFITIELTRPVTVLVPACPRMIPEQPCAEAESPIEIFRKLDFPTNAFIPTVLPDEAGD
ncbi:MAG: hypothetical protein IJY85_08235 [Ruminococcus sp.]|nr:hypothetical protein [Ruminococcus sp.]